MDTGVGNWGAVGIQYIANNQGSMRDVTIRSGDGRRVIGLDLSFSDEIGPALIKNLRVIGFNYGVKYTYTVDSMVFEHVTLEDQRVVGFYNSGQCVSIRGLVGRNDVSAVQNASGGLMTLIDPTLTTRGLSSAAGPAECVNRNSRAKGKRLVRQTRRTSTGCMPVCASTMERCHSSGHRVLTAGNT